MIDRGVSAIDVRDFLDWQSSHIPGAVHLELYTDFSEPGLSEYVGKADEVIIFGGGDSGPRAARAAAAAVSWGYEKVYYFKEGFLAWKAAGYPIVVPPR
jgi:rhodanese-related sulfurtransferase